jgi:hypothetical protein
MPLCAFCGHVIEPRDRVLRKDTCPACCRDLHCCRQCRFHDPAYHNQCREPKTDMVSDRERANLCDYFEFRGRAAAPAPDPRGQARRALDDLFRKNKA